MRNSERSTINIETQANIPEKVRYPTETTPQTMQKRTTNHVETHHKAKVNGPKNTN